MAVVLIDVDIGLWGYAILLTDNEIITSTFTMR